MSEPAFRHRDVVLLALATAVAMTCSSIMAVTSALVGQMLATVGKHVPPPAGVASPIYWGKEARLEELFRGTRSIQATRREIAFRYESTAHFIDIFRRFYGPTHKAFGVLDAAGQEKLTADLTALAARFNRRETSFVVPAEYLEVVIER